MRNDWSSTLSQSTRSYLYPSVSGSFVTSELLPKMDWLSLWKLRGSWTTSKTPADVYAINSVYTITNSAWGSLSSAAYPESIRSSVVMPESSETFEIGTAINLFTNRASIDFSYYSKRMYDGLTWGGLVPLRALQVIMSTQKKKLRAKVLKLQPMFHPSKPKTGNGMCL